MPDIDTEDIYSDSDTNLVIFRENTPIARVRAAIRWVSNVGFFVRLPGGRGLIAVNHLEDDTYAIDLTGIEL